MVDPTEQPTKKCRLSVCSSQKTKEKSIPQTASPDQVMNMDIDKQEQQTEISIVEESTFWTLCDKCSVRYKYYKIVMDKQIRCRHCRHMFIAKAISLSTNAGRDNSTVITSTTQTGNISSTAQVSPSPQSGNISTTVQVSPSSQPEIISKVGCMSLVPVPNNDFNSNGSLESLDCQKTQNQVAEEQGNETEIDHGMANFALASKELTDQISNSKKSAEKLVIAHDELFKQGLLLMIKGFFIRAHAANAKDLDDLLFYGKIIARNFADLGITDHGFCALLENLEKQAAVVISQQALASKWTSAHALFVDLLNAAECEISEAMTLKVSIDEKVGTYEVQVDEAEASLAEAREKEEMAKRARIKAEEELARKKEQLKAGEQSKEKANHACEVKKDALAKAKAKVRKAEEEIEANMQALEESVAKWRSLCEPFPGIVDRSL